MFMQYSRKMESSDPVSGDSESINSSHLTTRIITSKDLHSMKRAPVTESLATMIIDSSIN